MENKRKGEKKGIPWVYSGGDINVSKIQKNGGYIKIPILQYLYIVYNRL